MMREVSKTEAFLAKSRKIQEEGLAKITYDERGTGAFGISVARSDISRRQRLNAIKERVTGRTAGRTDRDAAKGGRCDVNNSDKGSHEQESTVQVFPDGTVMSTHIRRSRCGPGNKLPCRKSYRDKRGRQCSNRSGQFLPAQ